MPQELQVVKCFNCHMFQSDLVKKVRKWTCKVCGEKQSLKQVFGLGTGKECRLLVQQLNEKYITLLDNSKFVGMPPSDSEENDSTDNQEIFTPEDSKQNMCEDEDIKSSFVSKEFLPETACESGFADSIPCSSSNSSCNRKRKVDNDVLEDKAMYKSHISEKPYAKSQSKINISRANTKSVFEDDVDFDKIINF